MRTGRIVGVALASALLAALLPGIAHADPGEPPKSIAAEQLTQTLQTLNNDVFGQGLDGYESL